MTLIGQLEPIEKINEISQEKEMLPFLDRFRASSEYSPTICRKKYPKKEVKKKSFQKISCGLWEILNLY